MDTGIIHNIIDNKKAIVALNIEDCGGCMCQKSCNITEKGKNLIEAEYDENIKIGENVKLIFKPKKRFISSLLVFMAPLFVLILSYFIGYMFFKDEKYSILLSFGFFILYFLILIPVLNKNKFMSDFKPKIEKID